MNARSGLRFFIGAIIVLALAALAYKVYWSEQVRLYWNHPLYFFDGRHKLSGDARGITADLRGDLWIRDADSGRFMRLIPNAGIELAGEQNLSMVSARDGRRTMYKLRPQFSASAKDDFRDAAWEPDSNQYRLYFEQRRYSNDTLVSYYKDCAYGPGGLFFVLPDTGEHVARSNFSTLYVPAPTPGAFAGPTGWLWAAAANRAFVEDSVTGGAARAAWDAAYYRKVAPPANRRAPGVPGDLAVDGRYLYIYHSATAGWLRFSCDSAW